MLVTSCGGSETIASEDVVAELQDKIQLSVSIDPSRGSDTVSVLAPDDQSFGAFSIFVFQEGHEPTDSVIGDQSVPPVGDVVWGNYEPFPADLPEQGSYNVLKSYDPNLVLSYTVRGEPSSAYAEGYPPSPDELVLLDRTLASMTGTDTGTGPTSGSTG
jgi:hypothetical protein